MDKHLKMLNTLYNRLGSWRRVAMACCVDKRTINKWFAGERQMSAGSKAEVEKAMNLWKGTK